MPGLENLGTGGPIIAILGLLSLLSLTVIVVKVIKLAPVRAGGPARDAAFVQWSGGDRQTAQKAVAAGKSPADRVCAYAMQALIDGFKGPALMAELTRRGNLEFAAMNSWLRVLELIAMISPLLGLLGTVTGMIQSFQELELAQGAANASVLAGGIWQALLTTAAGLVVAIPAAIGASLLSGRAEAGAQSIENAVGRLMVLEERGAH
ncbi:MotA/TolQ/ExbB proton channel family protein [Ruegeria lacuscaerulensis]|uniref:MotA/TolQ/ExbB proton channel family protein n=1 Tax=Ruegeria lacuscaerulensis TaxID=55218 RepID=UPI00147C0200|nr:MotA/TolQ/ExbB proton channel family protein [Ruegeria lacuscaerulensis]